MIYFLCLSIRFTLIFYLIYGFCSFWSESYGANEVPSIILDSYVNFIPEFAYVYLSITPLFLLAPLILNRYQIKQLERQLLINVYIAAFFFIAYPTTIQIPETFLEKAQQSISFLIADLLNLNHNCFPSLHVALSLTGVRTYIRQLDFKFSVFMYFWFILIVLSTLFTYQHKFVDVIGGVILALAVEYFIKHKN